MTSALVAVTLLAASGGAPPATAAVHARVAVSAGELHVFAPAGYDPDTAALVLYVHGYYTDVDEACRAHQLPRQFALAERNALFVAPEAPSGDADAVAWPSLPQLLEVLASASPVPLPKGPVLVAAHSGGYRTVARWLPTGGVEGVLLLDGLYGREADFAQWLQAQPGGAPRLILVGAHTLARMQRFAQTVGDAHTLAKVPRLGAPGEPGDGKLVLIRSQFDHMQLVTTTALPSLLQLLLPADGSL